MSIDRTIVGWRAWYSGGRVFDSLHHSWDDLPGNGVVVVMLYERQRPHRKILSGASLYWRDPDGTFGRWGYDPSNPIDPPRQFDGRRVKGGDWVLESEFLEALRVAMLAEEAPDESLRFGPATKVVPWQ